MHLDNCERGFNKTGGIIIQVLNSKNKLLGQKSWLRGARGS